jgi:hypothetical protein
MIILPLRQQPRGIEIEGCYSQPCFCLTAFVSGQPLCELCTAQSKAKASFTYFLFVYLLGKSQAVENQALKSKCWQVLGRLLAGCWQVVGTCTHKTGDRNSQRLTSQETARPAARPASREAETALPATNGQRLRKS